MKLDFVKFYTASHKHEISYHVEHPPKSLIEDYIKGNNEFNISEEHHLWKHLPNTDLLRYCINTITNRWKHYICLWRTYVYKHNINTLYYSITELILPYQLQHLAFIISKPRKLAIYIPCNIHILQLIWKKEKSIHSGIAEPRFII